MHCADELEGGMGCTAIPGAITTGFSDLAPMCRAGEQDLPSGLSRRTGAGSAWQEAGRCL